LTSLNSTVAPNTTRPRVELGRIDHLRKREPPLDFGNPALDESLPLFACVIIGVLGEIAVESGPRRSP
jgi:hypothetical protein